MASLEHHSIFLCAGAFLLVACCHNVLAAPATGTDTGPANVVLTDEQRQYIKDIASYRQTIATISARDGTYAATLLEPLIELGRTLIRTGDYAEAADALHRAQNILHRSQGVDSLRQLGIVDLLQKIELIQGKPLSADQLARFSLFISEHNFPADSLQLLPSMFKLADWYMETAQNGKARKVLKRAEKIVAGKAGPKDPRMIDVLERQALNTQLGRLSRSYRYLEKARDIVKANPGLPTDEQAEVYVSLGDAYIESRKTDQAIAAYQAAWKLLGDKAASQKFGRPEAIPASRDLDLFRRLDRNTYVPDTNPMGTPPDLVLQGIPLLRLTDEEMTSYPYVSPQAFTVSDKPNQGYQISERPQPGKNIPPAQRLSGEPFQFLRSQLLETIFGARKDEILAHTVIHLDFTVGADGKTSDIQVTGNKVPRKIRDLMRQVVALTRFRPRIVDGKPVATEHVKLVQTFS